MGSIHVPNCFLLVPYFLSSILSFFPLAHSLYLCIYSISLYISPHTSLSFTFTYVYSCLDCSFNPDLPYVIMCTCVYTCPCFFFFLYPLLFHIFCFLYLHPVFHLSRTYRPHALFLSPSISFPFSIHY